MATRFYFSSTPQTSQSQPVNSDFTGSYSTFNRYWMEHGSKDNSAFTTLTNTVSMALNQSYCYGQWWSHPINNASSFTSANWNASTWTVLTRHSENSTSANYVYKYQLRIWDGASFVNNSFFTGGTEFDVGNGATTNSVMESRRISLGDYWGAIGPFSDGIRLVMELGVFRTSGAAASFTDYTEIGANGAADLDNSEIDTGQDNPYMECSLNFTFDAEPVAGAGSNQLMTQGVGA